MLWAWVQGWVLSFMCLWSLRQYRRFTYSIDILLFLKFHRIHCLAFSTFKHKVLLIWNLTSMFHLYLTQDAELEVEPLSSLKDSSAPRMASSTQQRPVNTCILTFWFVLVGIISFNKASTNTISSSSNYTINPLAYMLRIYASVHLADDIHNYISCTSTLERVTNPLSSTLCLKLCPQTSPISLLVVYKKMRLKCHENPYSITNYLPL